MTHCLGNIFTGNKTESIFLEREVLEKILYSIIPSTAVSFFGNVLQIFIVYRNNSMRTTPNLFTVNMAFANILFSASHLTTGFFSTRLSPSETLKTLAFFLLTLQAAPMASLVAVAFHRFYAVVFPMEARLENRRTCALTICFIWLFALALSSPVLFHMNCDKTYIHEVIYLIIIIILPFIVMACLYSIITVKLWQQTIPGYPSSVLVRSRRERNINLTKLFITVVTLFCLTHGSASILYLNLGKKISSASQAYVAIAVLHSLYPALNPFICFFYCEKYRKGFKDIFICHVQRYKLEVAVDANVKVKGQGQTISSQKELNIQSWQIVI